MQCWCSGRGRRLPMLCSRQRGVERESALISHPHADRTSPNSTYEFPLLTCRLVKEGQLDTGNRPYFLTSPLVLLRLRRRHVGREASSTRRDALRRQRVTLRTDLQILTIPTSSRYGHHQARRRLFFEMKDLRMTATVVTLERSSLSREHPHPPR